MKNLIVILLILLSAEINGQSIQLSMDTLFMNSSEVRSTIGGFKILNNTTDPIDINLTIKPTCNSESNGTAISIWFMNFEFAPINKETNFGDLFPMGLGVIEGQTIDSSFVVEPHYGNIPGSIWEVVFSDYNSPSEKASLIVMIDSCQQVSNTQTPYEDTNIEIFPNPFSEQITFRFHNIDKERKIKLVNLLGKEIGTYEATSKMTTIDLVSLVSGTYFAIIQSSKLHDQVKKILKD